MEDKRRCFSCGEVKIFKLFYKNKDTVTSRCRECKRAEPRDREKAQKYARKRKYGISHNTYTTMLTRQKGVCAVCLQPENVTTMNGEPKALSVHHSHKTGKVLGLCCSRCNIAMGMLKDDPDYLKRAADLNIE